MRDLAEISKKDFLDIFAPLVAPNYFQTLMATRVIYREGLNREIVSISPVASITPPKSRPKAQKFLTWEEVKNINFGKYDSHIKFLALHGLRWGEAVALKQADIFDEKVHINKSMYGPTKTESSVRAVPYFSYFKEFPRSRHAIAKILHEYHVTIHSLRKTYAYFLKTNDVHVTAAAKFLGHSDPTITLKIYTLVRDSEINEIGARLRSQLSPSNSGMNNL
jgi:integrase